MGCGCRGSGANITSREQQTVTKQTPPFEDRRQTDPLAPDSVWTGRKPLKPVRAPAR